MAHKCMVKFIHLEDMNPTHLHTLADYEYSTAYVSHSNYAELETNVHAACPNGFKCIDPIALHHEILWESSLKVTPRADGHHVVERDNLFHAIDESDYTDIHWTKPNCDPISVCVEIEKQSQAMG